MSVFSDDDQSISIMGEEYATFDPTMLDGYDLKFSYQVNVRCYEENDQEESDNPEIRTFQLRLFDKGSVIIGLEEIRIEIFSDKDVGFFLECIIDNNVFQNIVAENHLQVNFSQFEQSFKELIEKSIDKPDVVYLRLKLSSDYSGVLTFCQALRHGLRSFDVFSLQFQMASSEFIRSQVQYRFNQMKVKAQQKMQEIETKFGRLKAKNPQFEKQMRTSVMHAVYSKKKE